MVRIGLRMTRPLIVRLCILTQIWTAALFGRAWFCFGRSQAGLAKAEFWLKRWQTLDPSQFAPPFYLGRLYARRREHAASYRAFTEACRLAPDRFCNAPLPDYLKDAILFDLALTPRLGLSSEYFTRLWVDSPESSSPVTDRRRRTRRPALTVDPAVSASQTGADFVSAEEAARFSVLPPISQQDLDELDWDDLFRRLQDSGN